MRWLEKLRNILDTLGWEYAQCSHKVRALCDGSLLAEIEMHDKGRARREGR